MLSFCHEVVLAESESETTAPMQIACSTSSKPTWIYSKICESKPKHVEARQPRIGILEEDGVQQKQFPSQHLGDRNSREKKEHMIVHVVKTIDGIVDHTCVPHMEQIGIICRYPLESLEERVQTTQDIDAQTFHTVFYPTIWCIQHPYKRDYLAIHRSPQHQSKRAQDGSAGRSCKHLSMMRMACQERYLPCRHCILYNM